MKTIIITTILSLLMTFSSWGQLLPKAEDLIRDLSKTRPKLTKEFRYAEKLLEKSIIVLTKEKKMRAPLLKEIILLYQDLLKKSDDSEWLYPLVPYYEKNKKLVEDTVKSALPADEQKSFMEHLKTCAQIAKEGNG